MTRPLLAFGAGVLVGTSVSLGFVLRVDVRRSHACKVGESSPQRDDLLREFTAQVPDGLDEAAAGLPKAPRNLLELIDSLHEADDKSRRDVMAFRERLNLLGERFNAVAHSDSFTSGDSTLLKVGHGGVAVAAAVSDPGGPAASDLSHAGPSRGCAEGCCDD